MSLEEFIAARNAMLQIEKTLYVAEIRADNGEEGECIETPEGVVITHYNQTDDDPYMVAIAEDFNIIEAYCMRFKNRAWKISRDGKTYAYGFGKNRKI